jgi:hypothetical protein
MRLKMRRPCEPAMCEGIRSKCREEVEGVGQRLYQAIAEKSIIGRRSTRIDSTSSAPPGITEWNNASLMRRTFRSFIATSRTRSHPRKSSNLPAYTETTSPPRGPRDRILTRKTAQSRGAARRRLHRDLTSHERTAVPADLMRAAINQSGLDGTHQDTVGILTQKVERLARPPNRLRHVDD